MKYSIVVVTYNRQKELLNCLESIARCASPYLYEVIVIFNGDRAYIEKCAQLYKNFKMTFIHKTTPANARNFAASQASGDYFFFLDDDCVLPEDYFSNLDFTLGWDVLGGPDQTPLQSNAHQQVTGQALSSPLCMGLTYKRHTSTNEYDSEANEQSLILCNLWLKASLFRNEFFKFNGELFRNEENYLLKKLKNNGKIIHYNSKLFVYHQRKDGLEKLGAAIIKSGECRVQNFALLPKAKELLYFLPLVWFSLLIFMVFHPMAMPLVGYLIFTVAIIFYNLVTNKSFSFRYIFLHYYILISYAIGLIKGLTKFSPLLYSNLKENKSLINESSIK